MIHIRLSDLSLSPKCLFVVVFFSAERSKAIPLLQYFFLHVGCCNGAVVSSLFATSPFLFQRLTKAVLRDCDFSLVTSFYIFGTDISINHCRA